MEDLTSEGLLSTSDDLFVGLVPSESDAGAGSPRRARRSSLALDPEPAPTNATSDHAMATEPPMAEWLHASLVRVMDPGGGGEEMDDVPVYPTELVEPEELD